MPRDMSKELAPALERMLTTLEKKVDPSHTALIVIDMQNEYCANGGVFDKEGFDLSLIRAMVPRLVDFIDKAREAGLLIIYIQAIYASENMCYLSDVVLEHSMRTGKGRHIEYPMCERGSWYADFYAGIKPLPGEVIVQKHRYSAFIDTDLDLILRSKKIRTLIMSGVASNVCVETTAKDGFMRDYYIVFLNDCTAAVSEELHNSALRSIARNFGEVVESSDVARCWEKR